MLDLSHVLKEKYFRLIKTKAHAHAWLQGVKTQNSKLSNYVLLNKNDKEN